ncbi:MAG TPA: hypothetical protein VN030_07240 [Cellvibrio sp.]|nr:hypothetical protein [Cellvibrio sp.]
MPTTIAMACLRSLLLTTLLLGLSGCGGGGTLTKPSTTKGEADNSSAASSLPVNGFSSINSSSTSIEINKSSSSRALENSSAGSSSLSVASSSESGPPLPCEVGEYRNESGVCVLLDPAYPKPIYFPAHDEVVIYVNSPSKNFSGYTLFLWEWEGDAEHAGCIGGWAASQTDGVHSFTAPYEWWPGLATSSTDLGWPLRHDPIYGAYFVVKTGEGSCANFILRAPALASQTIDLQVAITRSEKPYERMLFIIDHQESLRRARVSAHPICINDLCEPIDRTSISSSSASSSSASSIKAVPSGIASDGTYLYVADPVNHLILKQIIATGETSIMAGSPGLKGSSNYRGQAALFNEPLAITLQGTNLYVADYGNNTIRKIDILTNDVALLGTGYMWEYNLSWSIDIASDGENLYFTQASRIVKKELATGWISEIAGAPIIDFSNPAGFVFPQGILVAGDYLYVADSGSYVIRKIKIATGEMSVLAGKPGVLGSMDGIGEAANFSWPRGMATDGTCLYIADTGNKTIRKLELASGKVTTLAGVANVSGHRDGRGSEALFGEPRALAIDGGNLYVTDAANGVVRKIVIATAEVTTLPLEW